ncbi:MAG: hypothetical protein NZ805_02920 [Armatimonadetes bacterium]|nr:hypothetical protein [Armatimonadota bacterium]MDW8027785.1 hypothetical protein [Armatimonadota bacterium]
MRTIICPCCGEWMDEDHPDFPNCVFCGEQLNRCGLCRAFPGDGKPCQRARGKPIVYASTTINCPSFSPKFIARHRRASLPSHLRWQMAASLMFTLSVLVIAFLSRPVPTRILVSARAPSKAILGDSLEVKMLVKTPSNQPLRLRLDRRLLTDFQLVGMSPLPSQVKQVGRFYEFILPVSSDLQPISVRFKCTRVGEYAMKATIMTAPKNWTEWQTKVKVVERIEQPKTPKGLAMLVMGLWR